MTRRTLLAGALTAATTTAITVPVAQIIDRNARFHPAHLRRYTRKILPEAFRDFRRAGIHLQLTEQPGEILRYPTGRPLFKGLHPGAINLVLTVRTPLSWDAGRGVAGTATRYEGHDICLIALDEARPHQIPFVSVNTCVHELLHILLDDTRTARPHGWRGSLRESRIDALATRLWLFGDGAEIHTAAANYLRARQTRRPV